MLKRRPEPSAYVVNMIVTTMIIVKVMISMKMVMTMTMTMKMVTMKIRRFGLKATLDCWLEGI